MSHGLARTGSLAMLAAMRRASSRVGGAHNSDVRVGHFSNMAHTFVSDSFREFIRRPPTEEPTSGGYLINAVLAPKDAKSKLPPADHWVAPD
jgi:hypothetical protein